jgi:hypothetical protein
MLAKTTTINDEEGQLVFVMADAIREALLPFMNEDQLPLLISLSMTAAATYAGIQIGTLIAIGVARDQDKKRMVDMMARNVRNGIDIGKKNTFSAAEKVCGEAGHA